MIQVNANDLIAAASDCAGDPEYDVRNGPLAQVFADWLAGPEEDESEGY